MCGDCVWNDIHYKRGRAKERERVCGNKDRFWAHNVRAKVCGCVSLNCVSKSFRVPRFSVCVCFSEEGGGNCEEGFWNRCNEMWISISPDADTIHFRYLKNKERRHAKELGITFIKKFTRERHTHTQKDDIELKDRERGSSIVRSKAKRIRKRNFKSICQIILYIILYIISDMYVLVGNWQLVSAINADFRTNIYRKRQMNNQLSIILLNIRT